MKIRFPEIAGTDREALSAVWREAGYYADETLADVILKSAERFPDSFIALEGESVGNSVRYSQAESLRISMNLASSFRACGLQRGDVVAVQLPNSIEAAHLTAAVWLAGGVLLPIVPIYGTRELIYILSSSGAKMFFCPGEYRGRDWRDSIDKYRQCSALETIVVVAEEAPEDSITFSTFRSLSQNTDLEYCPQSADDAALLVYTSGTTSDPKGAVHTHNTLLAELRAGISWDDGELTGAQLNPWPFGHIGQLLLMLRGWYGGLNTVLVERWSPEIAAKLIETYRIQSTSGVPFFLEGLLDVAERGEYDLSSLLQYGTGAANVSSRLVKRCNELGITTVRLYGLTEHPTVTAGAATDPLEKRSNTEGRCLPGNRVRIVDDDGNDVASGEEGEVLTLGPELFVGYVDAELNESAFLEGGWFRTGDIGFQDERGYLTIVDRKKDIIIRGGENISSREVEELMLSIPVVKDCAAIAVPDERLGEHVGVVVVLEEGKTIDITEINRHFEQAGIAKQKTPETLRTCSELPRNATGKIQKHVLREWVGV